MVCNQRGKKTVAAEAATVIGVMKRESVQLEEGNLIFACTSFRRENEFY